MSDTNWQLKESDPFAPNCGACPGDGSICKTSCRVAEESPPVAVADIKVLLREHLTMSQFGNAGALYAELNIQRKEAADHIEAQEDRIAMLESEAEQLRMAWKNAEMDAVRFVLFFEAIIADELGMNLTPVQAAVARAFKITYCPKTVDDIRALFDAAMKEQA